MEVNEMIVNTKAKRKVERKRYKEALEIAKGLLANKDFQLRDEIRRIFPELQQTI